MQSKKSPGKTDGRKLCASIFPTLEARNYGRSSWTNCHPFETMFFQISRDKWIVRIINNCELPNRERSKPRSERVYDAVTIIPRAFRARIIENTKVFNMQQLSSKLWVTREKKSRFKSRKWPRPRVRDQSLHHGRNSVRHQLPAHGRHRLPVCRGRRRRIPLNLGVRNNMIF